MLRSNRDRLPMEGSVFGLVGVQCRLPYPV